MQPSDRASPILRKPSASGHSLPSKSWRPHFRDPAGQRAWWFSLGCGVLAVAIVAVFNLIFYDHYAPLPEGWFSVYADLIRKGQLPYRDIYFFLPPVFILFITAVQAVLGPEIIMLRLVGVLIILICTGALFKILHECFGPVAAFFAAVAGMIYYQTGIAHIGYDFFQVMNLAMLLACVCLLRFNRNLQQELRRGK